MFRGSFAASTIRLDVRDHIGPHHLAIGKTRKLFERDGTIHAFFSRGFEIAHARLAGEELGDVRTLPFPAAWGGGAFCVDERAGRIALVFLHRNQHELCFVRGKAKDGDIEWEDWRTLLVSRARQAAPWVELGPDGTAWASVLDRDQDTRLAVIPPEGDARICDLFEPGEARWYHSCVQMLPVAADRALAISFRGEFPTRTELVFKTVGADLALGPATALAPCNVNDKLTFHFQAVGDSERRCAHIVYLDDGLSVSHALYEKGEWRVVKSIVAAACFAPQICIDQDGNAALLAADYDGALWRAAWSRAHGWSQARKVAHAKAPNVSPLFSQTGYGSGGMIAAARSANGRMPYLFAVIEDDRKGRAALHAAVLGDDRALDPSLPVAVALSGKTLGVEIRLRALRGRDLGQAGRSWLAIIPAEAGRALKIAFMASAKGLVARAYWLERDGSHVAVPASVNAEIHDAFSPGEAGVLRGTIEFAETPAALNVKNAWAEIYDGGILTDIAPFEPETAATMALDPARIASTFKRMV